MSSSSSLKLDKNRHTALLILIRLLTHSHSRARAHRPHYGLNGLPADWLTDSIAYPLSHSFVHFSIHLPTIPQWGAADAEIKVPSGENTELTGSPFKAWSRSVYSHTCYAYCQGFFLAYFYTSGPFTCILSKPLPSFSRVCCG